MQRRRLKGAAFLFLGNEEKQILKLERTPHAVFIDVTVQAVPCVLSSS